MSNLPLLIIGDYYNYSHDKNDERKIETGQGYCMGYGWCDELCPTAMGLSLVTLFSLSMSIEDRPLLWMSGHRLIILSTYLLMGAERLVTLLSWVPALSELTDWRRRKVEV